MNIADKTSTRTALVQNIARLAESKPVANVAANITKKNREHLLEVHREYYYRKKLKLIREVLSAAKEALNREENL